MLNEYFNVIGPIVNKFIGDAMIAVYHVPLDQTQHALRAVRSAPKMRDTQEVLDTQRVARDQMPLHIGIGVNSGPVVAGNIGHEQRLEYTVIGNAANLAQRIEGPTKEAGAVLLV